MSQLSQEIVMAVERALPAAYDRATGFPACAMPTTDPEDWAEEARAAAVAALVALSRRVRRIEDTDLLELAQEIEGVE
ncbi:hypothetical protein [Amycolatopsis lexingtonensis]|uniref:hypothetical protein n=1 Tax=Amycolatopsis lexingtonensis TaxID=218822 RepID=UPI003F728219